MAITFSLLSVDVIGLGRGGSRDPFARRSPGERWLQREVSGVSLRPRALIKRRSGIRADSRY